MASSFFTAAGQWQGITPTPAPTSWDGSFLDLGKLSALLSTAKAGADGRKVLAADDLLPALNPLSGLTLKSGGVGAYTARASGDSDEVYQVAAEGAIYQDKLGRTYRDLGSGRIQFFDNSGGGWENPTGSAHDRVQPIYQLSQDGTAKPIASGTSYKPSTWVDVGRDLAKWAVVMATAGTAGAYLGAAGAAEGGTAAGIGAEGAGLDAVGSNLTMQGALESGYSTTIGMDGFGSGLGSTLTETGAVDSFGSLGAWGTAAGVPAELSFAGQGIALGGSAAASGASTATKAAADSIASAGPAAPAASALPTLGQLAGGAGTLAGLVGQGLGLADQLNGSGKTAPGRNTNSAAPRSNLLVWLALGGVAFLALNKGKT